MRKATIIVLAFLTLALSASVYAHSITSDDYFDVYESAYKYGHGDGYLDDSVLYWHVKHNHQWIQNISDTNISRWQLAGFQIYNDGTLEYQSSHDSPTNTWHDRSDTAIHSDSPDDFVLKGSNEFRWVINYKELCYQDEFGAEICPSDWTETVKEVDH